MLAFSPKQSDDFATENFPASNCIVEWLIVIYILRLFFLIE
jgi:hypothetical protein